MLKRSRSEDVASSDEDQQTTGKYTQLDLDGRPNEPVVMTCSLPPHADTVSFSSYEAYDVHYRQFHSNNCLECHASLPMEHFLTLHIAENHDPLNEAKKARGEKTYACFVQGCDKVCLTPQKRRMHLVDKHLFPKNYDFNVVNDGLGKRKSMLKHGDHRARYQDFGRANNRQSQALTAAAIPAIQTENGELPSQAHSGDASNPLPSAECEVESITTAMSALKFVPPSIRFGRGGGRAGFAKK